MLGWLPFPPFTPSPSHFLRVSAGFLWLSRIHKQGHLKPGSNRIKITEIKYICFSHTEILLLLKCYLSPTAVLMFRGQKQCHLAFICVCVRECECAGFNESLNWLHISYLKGKWVDTLSITITSHQNSNPHSNCPTLCFLSHADA